MTACDGESRPDAPRTDAEPLAFTRTEFLRGAGRAWLWTTLLLIAAWAVVSRGSSVIIGTVIILIWSVPALFVGACGAYVLGHALRRTPRIGLHLGAFAGYGALIGTATSMAAVFVLFGSSEGFGVSPLFSLVNVPLSAIGVAGAWFVTMRRALRADAAGFGDDGFTTPDVDAAVEDALDERHRVIDPRQRPRG